ncbi:chemotaxis protein CheW [Sporosarcina pasteurii]|uniref:Coupling protein CheW n=2 Tax=Sporosarcina pasteurii TaxID=1474 RepID=A0A380BGX8_SPOPA|nr:chemotaxis protein CheW [Sporosarcina pasteurii]MDS9470603.1 chemotaxis protein CheW [Sporosarcina pasteurii]QBQ05710.1 chemotaxis protein CheW [Sporosarcina pasteurii]SUJ00888.1 Coupling protein CheW [Sporosarcina pasteurii]
MTEIAQQELTKVIIFELMDKEYAIEIDVVQGIERVMSITRVPKTPSYVKGVINLRGVVTPTIDLRERFLLEPKEMDDRTRIIIVSLEDYDVGLIVDGANDVIDLPLSAIEPQPQVVGSVASEFISGVAKVEERLFVLLELTKVLEPIKRAEVT